MWFVLAVKTLSLTLLQYIWQFSIQLRAVLDKALGRMSHLFLSERRIKSYVYAEVISVLSAMYCKEMKKSEGKRYGISEMAPHQNVSSYITWLDNFSTLCMCVTLVSRKCEQENRRKMNMEWSKRTWLKERTQKGGGDQCKMNSNPSFYFSGMV